MSGGLPPLPRHCILSLQPSAGTPHWLKPIRENGALMSLQVVLTGLYRLLKSRRLSGGQMEDIQLTGLGMDG